MNKIIRPGEFEPTIQADTPIITPDGTFTGLDQALTHFIRLADTRARELDRLKSERATELRAFAGALELLHEKGADGKPITMGDLFDASDRRNVRMAQEAR